MSAESDLDLLIATAIERAQDSMSEHGGFPPFGLGIETAQPETEPELSLVEVGSENGEPVSADESLPVIIESFGEGRENWRAVAVAFESELEDGRDALVFLLQHESGVGVDLTLTYRIEGDSIYYDEPEQRDASLTIWQE
jgi:hypothetical protein